MKTLLTWSDRGVKRIPLHQRIRPKNDEGPIMRMLKQRESRNLYRHAVVLTPKAGKKAAKQLVKEMTRYVDHVELRVVALGDPSDYEWVFQRAKESTLDIANTDLDVLLSAGTPQMQAVWLLLVKAGLLKARMLQVIPPAFVPDPHPRAIKEVELDFDGFPEILALRQEVARLRSKSLIAPQLIGSSDALALIRNFIEKVAISNIPVLISGPSGSGKELCAQAIHMHSMRSNAPFVAENCGALAEGVLESQLFGHERGAFTGAEKTRRGLFEEANGGTLFLDEVAELSPKTQASLLRVLQESKVKRVGGEREIAVDVRIIAASHRNLKEMVDQGKFREDLYYRLRGAETRMPALRERPQDIDELVTYFLEQEFGDDIPRITEKVMQQMRRYAWPGNVRELRTEIARWRVFGGDTIRKKDLSTEILTNETAPTHSFEIEGISLKELVQATEERAIRQTLEKNNGNILRSSKELGIDRNTLKRKMERIGMRWLAPFCQPNFLSNFREKLTKRGHEILISPSSLT